MGSFGVWEMMFIMLIALLVFGPKKLPEIGRTIGRSLGEFRRASNELKRSLNTELALEEEAPARPRRIEPPRVAPVGTEPLAEPAVAWSEEAPEVGEWVDPATLAAPAEPAAEPEPVLTGTVPHQPIDPQPLEPK